MEDILIYLTKSSGLLLLFYLCYLLLRKDNNFYIKRKYLLAGILTSAILPAIYLTRNVYIDAVPEAFNFVDSDAATPKILQEDHFSWSSFLLIIYFSGVIMMLFRLFIQLFSLFRIISEGRTEKIKKNILVEVQKEIAPFSFLNYIVFNPNLHSEKDLQHILKHEKVHTKQWHSADVILSNLNLVFQWFNPIAWLYNKSLQENLEFIADAEAVKSAASKKEYQKALVQISVKNFQPELTTNFYQSFIKKRIVMLNKNGNSRHTGWKIQLILPVLIAFMLVFNVKTVAQIQNSTPTGYAQDSAKDKVQITATITRTSTKNSLEKIEEHF